MSEKLTLRDIEEKAKQVYGNNYYTQLENEGIKGVYIQVGSKTSKKNSITVWSRYEQEAIDEVHAEIISLPEYKRTLN